jgi:hydrocephalus-inducing protein
VRFICNKEMKLKTQNTTTDITLEILEGKTKELFKPVPINVAVNAVYSKYSISPMNSINFGSLQFNETKTRILEIKNDGLFDFNFTIFDYHNEEARKEINEANELYKESLKVLQV